MVHTVLMSAELWWRPVKRVISRVRKSRIYVRRPTPFIRTRHGKVAKEAYRKAARALAHARLEHFNQHYHFTYARVFIKDTKSRWGSCSIKSNLNFNYRIALLPPELADFVIVHELCHLKEMNHSPHFWALVAETIPEWQVLRSRLLKL